MTNTQCYSPRTDLLVSQHLESVYSINILYRKLMVMHIYRVNYKSLALRLCKVLPLSPSMSFEQAHSVKSNPQPSDAHTGYMYAHAYHLVMIIIIIRLTITIMYCPRQSNYYYLLFQCQESELHLVASQSCCYLISSTLKSVTDSLQLVALDTDCAYCVCTSPNNSPSLAPGTSGG